jgi:hypothetical protein
MRASKMTLRVVIFPSLKITESVFCISSVEASEADSLSINPYFPMQPLIQAMNPSLQAKAEQMRQFYTLHPFFSVRSCVLFALVEQPDLLRKKKTKSGVFCYAVNGGLVCRVADHGLRQK